jgi:glycerophosphoryl diester phosphodiesterase
MSTVKRPLVIGHRGASGHRPEHTLESYGLAIEMGADFIEPDLVSTKDGVLVVRHENEIGGTTNVASKFPARKTTKTVDGVKMEGWFTEDFTLAEIKTLRAKERLPERSQAFDGRFMIPTFEEVILFAKEKSREKGRTIGLYPETKHPSYFRAVGLALEPKLIALLNKHGLNEKDAAVYVQSFEVGNLKALRKELKVPLLQLMEEGSVQPADFVASGDKRTYADLMTPAGLREVATYANGIGPWKRSIIGEDPVTKKLLPPTSLVKDAHAAGLLVHPYTFRSDPQYLNAAYANDPSAEYRQFFELGVDGVFSDFTDDAVRAREAFFK